MSQQSPRLSLLWRILSRHYGVTIAAAYVFAAVVGTAYYAILFDYFGLSVFDYWEAGDVLLAAFRKPVSLVFGVLAVVLAVVHLYAEEYNEWLRSKGNWAWKLFGNYYMQRMGWKWKAGPMLTTLLASFWFMVVINGVAIDDGQDVWQSKTDLVEVATDDGMTAGRFIANTNRFVVLLEASADVEAKRRTAFAFPVESIRAIRLCASRGGMLRRLVHGEACAATQPAMAKAPAAE